MASKLDGVHVEDHVAVLLLIGALFAAFLLIMTALTLAGVP